MGKMKLLVKSGFNHHLERLMERRRDEPKLEYFRGLILDHLDKQEDEEGKDVSKTLNKALNLVETLAKGGKGLPVGTVRDWKGKKYVKTAPGKWRPSYNSENRGAKMAVSAIKRKIAACKDAQSMLQIVLENRDRFSDAQGNPLPFVQELSKYVAETQDMLPKDMKTRQKTKEGEIKRYNGGTRQQRLSRLKEDFVNGGITRESAVKLYTRIYPKMTAENAEKVVDRLWTDEKKNLADKKQQDKNITHEQAALLDGLNSLSLPPAQGSISPLSHKDDNVSSGSNTESKPKKQETADEKRHNRSEAMKGNKNAYKGGEKDDESISPDTQEEISLKLDSLAVPMEKVEFTRSEYNKLFPEGKITTPIGSVKLGEGQFDKLEDNDRQELLGAMSQTLKDPVVILEEKREGKDARLYIKSFRDTGAGKTDFVQSVVVKIEGENVSISTSQRRPKQIDGKIKTAGILLYLKGEKGGSQTHWNGGKPSDARQGEVYHTPENKSRGSGFEKIQDKYENAKSIEGDDYEVQVGNEAIPGRWKLVEAETPTASHDEQTFRKTPGFPETEDGGTINDRDYQHDKDAQEMVLQIAGDYNGQAVSFDSPVIVTKDGIVISGNNRTMSSKIAARKGTDKAYIETLKKRSKMFGFTPSQIDDFKHPRVVFETEKNNGYTTEEFAKYNVQTTKTMNPVEKAVKASKTIKGDVISNAATVIAKFETLGELYADSAASTEIFDALQKSGIITQMDRPQYITDGSITGAGKEFLETVLIGSVINESNIRAWAAIV